MWRHHLQSLSAGLGCIILLCSCATAEATPTVNQPAAPTSQETATVALPTSTATLEKTATKAPPTRQPTETQTPSPSATPTQAAPLTVPDATGVAVINSLPWSVAYASGDQMINVHSKDGDLAVQYQDDSTKVHHSPSWSPDGRYIAYTVVADDSKERVLFRDLKTQDEFKIGYGAYPTWSPDGLQIIYSKDGDLVSYNRVTKRNLKLIDTPDKIEVEPAWSPSGYYIAYIAYPEGNSELAEIIQFIPKDKRIWSTEKINPSIHGRISWAPNGEFIAFRSNEGCGRICTQKITGPTNYPAFCHESPFQGERDPAWSPDGEWILFSATNDSSACQPENVSSSASWQLYLMKRDGSYITAFEPGLGNTGAVWSPITPITLQAKLEVTPLGHNLRLRAEPSTDAKVFDELGAGTNIIPLEGPVVNGDQTWWKIRTVHTQLEGWILEGAGWLRPHVEEDFR